MKQSLQLKLGQQLTMTPQLQQAIRLLQLSTLDLQQEIQAALDSNPLLELEGEEASAASSSEDKAAEGDEPQWEQDIPTELPVDTQWEDIYPTSSGTGLAAPADSDYDIDARNSAEETLQDHLLWQLNLSRMDDRQQIIALTLIDAIDEAGRLTVPVEDLHRSLLAEDLDFERAEVDEVLRRIQQFDPPGVGAGDLRECLLIQLEQLPPDTPWREEAYQLISQYIHLLESRDYAQLQRRSRLTKEEIRQALQLVRSLTPFPGERIAPEPTEYIVPDVFVRRRQDRWVVELNPDIAPRLRINSNYASLIRRADSSADNTFLRDNLQEARWFLRSLQSRNETLLKVASRIVEVQRGFFEYGEVAMKPLVLNDIAEAVDMHESTISRVTTQKYMHTPRGVFELKYFFSSHVGTDSGGECSSTAIRALIRNIVAEECPRKPLSDARITTLLSEQGIRVARRTIAKYRESMAIPPSHERRRLV